MFGKTYYHGLLEKYVILFGTLFNDIWINRPDVNDNVINSQKVPLSYSPREKLLARINGIEENKDPLKQPFAVSLPRMGFEIMSFDYDPMRKMTTTNRFIKNDTANQDKRSFLYTPVPYNINFDLSIFVKNTSDGTRIIEQILPYFTPEWNVTVELIQDPSVILDIPIILTTINQEDVYEGSFDERRSLIWTLSFTMKGYFFGPVRDQSVIKLANTNIYDYTIFDGIGDDSQEAATRITITPGLDSNGYPTTDVNNTIDRSLIKSTDPFDYIIKIESPPNEE